MKINGEEALEFLEERLSSVALADYPRQSRVHRLNTFDLSGVTTYVKREDELGFGISGTKVRKYLSLLPSLCSQKPQEVILIGGPFSNHILGMVQLLRENAIEPILFLRGEPPSALRGNFLFTSWMSNPENIHWIKREENIEVAAETYLMKRRAEGAKILLVPEGGSSPEALPGLLTLACDIIRNEKGLSLAFDHIFIDAGTGMAASVLILVLSWLQKCTQVHVLLLAGNQEEFRQRLEMDKLLLEAFLKQSLPSPTSYNLYLPQNAPSFGSVNAQVKANIRFIAEAEGILTDPIYSAKLFDEGKKILASSRIQGNVLFIHSGGALTLSGFFS